MSTGEYLNEEKYQKGRKALIRAAILVIVAGVLIGGGLIIGGVIKKNSASQIDTSMPVQRLDADYNSSVRQGNAWIDRASAKGNEEVAANGMIGGGGMVIMVSIMIALPLFVLANQRKIIAFQAQTVAPVAKEGVEKATPVVSKAAGSIAREISKGIKEEKAEGAGGKEESEG